ncbi:MAG TPA: hypothetical protein VEK15_30970, partial [Vicinamibacteria bacterium]|nr:hypothetical protein [Vicinamibacteria bacterium]
MKRVVADKIASVARGSELAPELRLSDEIPCEEGVLIAAEVLTAKTVYNTLELTSGRMAPVNRGDVIVGALGHREALFGYSGEIPESLETGEVIQLLNLGGVLGRLTGADPGRGAPFDCRVLGCVLSFPFLGERVGVPARVGFRRLQPDVRLEVGAIPVIAVAGTCMDSGKTVAASAIVSRLRHRGFLVDAFKATGVSLLRDVLSMEDAGARQTRIFTDYGVVATTDRNAASLAKSMLTDLASDAPDVIVFELGDGLMGAYGVQSILKDADIKNVLTAVVLSANDPVAAFGGVTLLRDVYGIE